MSNLSVTTGQSSDAEKLCAMLLELAGRGPGRMATARRHAHILDAAMMYMNPVQRAEACRRITVLETKWGPMLAEDLSGQEIDDIPPETRVARWLSTRKAPTRYLHVLHRAASKFADGETCLSNVMEYAFALETDHVLCPVGFDSFKEWMIELRIARRQSKGVYVPGGLCKWWFDQMSPGKDKRSAYHACLELAEQMRRGVIFQRPLRGSATRF